MINTSILYSLPIKSKETKEPIVMAVKCRVKTMLSGLFVALFVVSCGTTREPESGQQVSVSIPAMAYFVERLTPDSIEVNVMVPQSVGHSDYTLRPSQLTLLTHSRAYFALGNLDFELSWREKMLSVATNMQWCDMSSGVQLINGGCNHSHQCEHHHATDPHYWLSPKQVRHIINNMASVLVDLNISSQQYTDSAKNVLLSEVDVWNSRFDSLASNGKNLSFMIYHPSLSYLARDYGMTQYEIEKEGNAPTPKSMIEEIEKSVADSVGIVFVQQGYDIQKAESAAQEIGAEVIEIAPDGYDWNATMTTIYNALKR